MSYPSFLPSLCRIPHLEQLRLQVSRITMFDYEQHHYDKEKLRCNSSSIGLIMIDQDADLEQVRHIPPESSVFLSFSSFISLSLFLFFFIRLFWHCYCLFLVSHSSNYIFPFFQVRKHINRMMEENTNRSRPNKPLSESWCFLDCKHPQTSSLCLTLLHTSIHSFIYPHSYSLISSLSPPAHSHILPLPACTAERFFRIDRAQEHLHYVTDICTEDLFVLDPEFTDPTNLGGVRGDVR